MAILGISIIVLNNMLIKTYLRTKVNIINYIVYNTTSL